MATAKSTSAGRAQLLHVGFVIPLQELTAENEILKEQLGHLGLRPRAFSAALFYRDTNQDTLYSWFEQRKRSSRPGYLRAYYSKKGDAVIEMDVDGKQFYLIASATTAKAPIEMKKDISRGLFGERKEFPDRVQVPCFPYKYEAAAGFIYCEALDSYLKEKEEEKINNAAEQS